MIIIPGGAPGPSTDYSGAWSALSRRTKRRIMLLAPVPILVGIAALVVQDGLFTDFAFAVAFLIWGSIAGYIGLVSDNRRIRKRREKTQFHPLADAELSAAERKDAMFDARRKASIEAMKRRRQRS